MAVSSPILLAHFKSPWRCLCRALFQSRQRWREKANQQHDLLQQQQQRIRHAQQRERQLINKLDSLQKRCDVLQTEVNNLKMLPEWTPMPGHQFSAEMISLCCSLSNLIGFRAVPKVLQCIADALCLPLRIPSRDAVRNWNCRNGVAILQQAEKADDWIWMVDHSVQLGKMFVLIVLGIRRDQMPRDRPLQRQDMTPLAVMPTDSRNKQRVSDQLLEVATACGTPLAVVSDGAAELHEGMEHLKTAGFQGVHLDDIKHKISNLLKKTLGRDHRFKAFEAKIGMTTASIQQTELEHLLPPRKKEKCRFMNFDRLIDWALMVETQLHHHPEPANRLTEKLGWLSEFRDDLCAWRECRQLIGEVLTHANTKGVYRGGGDELGKWLAELPASSALAQDIRQQMQSFYQSNEAQLVSLGEENLCLPCSTEVLESAFGSFKAIQRQHTRGTFTTLLSVFATLFDHCTPEKIRERFSLVTNRDLQLWLAEVGLTNSTQSRRTRAYRQSFVPT